MRACSNGEVNFPYAYPQKNVNKWNRSGNNTIKPTWLWVTSIRLAFRKYQTRHDIHCFSNEDRCWFLLFSTTTVAIQALYSRRILQLLHYKHSFIATSNCVIHATLPMVLNVVCVCVGAGPTSDLYSMSSKAINYQVGIHSASLWPKI